MREGIITVLCVVLLLVLVVLFIPAADRRRMVRLFARPFVARKLKKMIPDDALRERLRQEFASPPPGGDRAKLELAADPQFMAAVAAAQSGPDPANRPRAGRRIHRWYHIWRSRAKVWWIWLGR